MALDRTNMVSLLDIGFVTGGEQNLVEMGDGYTELTEDWGPDVESTQYVNMKTKASTLKGYDFSMTPEREHLSDEMQSAINTLFKKFPTGTECETHYYRYYKTDIDTVNGTGDCIRVPVIVSPSSTGGAGGDILTSSIQINGNGDVELGTVTISDNGFTWAANES